MGNEGIGGHRGGPAGGYTPPGQYPVARLSLVGNVFVQQHEALHHHFDSLTTIGNVMALLAQGTRKWPGPQAKVAGEVLASWSDAISPLLEGVINYVALKRTARRVDRLVSVADLLPSLAIPYWRRWHELFEGLGLSDGSRDALAMGVAARLFNVPIYDTVRDLSRLNQARSLITEELIERRFDALVTGLISPDASLGLAMWDMAMTNPQLDRLSPEKRSGIETAATADALTKLVPTMSFHPSARVPESVELAREWSAQIRALGGGPGGDLVITNHGYVDGMDNLIVAPGAQPRSDAFPLPDPKMVQEVLERDDAMYGLLILHRGDADFQFSRRYGRLLSAGDIYARLAFVRMSPDRVDHVPEALFSIAPFEGLRTLLAELAHPRIATVRSSAGDLSVADCIQSLPPDASFWDVRWATRVADFAAEMEAAAERVRWMSVITLEAVQAVFWFVRRTDRPALEVLPVAWDHRESATNHADRILDSLQEEARRDVPLPLLYAGCCLLTLEAF